jgi:hypothetical protein
MDTVEVRIVKAIETDLSNRRGIGDEWQSIDNETKEAIREIWVNIIREEFANNELNKTS